MRLGHSLIRQDYMTPEPVGLLVSRPVRTGVRKAALGCGQLLPLVWYAPVTMHCSVPYELSICLNPGCIKNQKLKKARCQMLHIRLGKAGSRFLT